VGQWRHETTAAGGRTYLAVGYGVTWAGRAQAAPLVLSVLEDKAAFDREVAIFERTLWTWLGGAGALLLLTQALLLEWGLSPLRRVAREISRIEQGDQAEVAGTYPAEIAALTDNLNTLIRQERVRQTRYKEALSFLAHSLKTPLAVLRTALGEPAGLPAAVTEQVRRMDDIVQHQLGRAAASGATRFAPYLTLAPVLHRIRDSLQKVHADKALDFSVDCPPELSWRIDEGDAFEMLGNVMDNAAKWARRRVAVRVWREAGRLTIRVDDDGPGFSDTQSILQLHVRGDEQVPGHGVGLAVVKDLVASHEGQLALSRSDLGGARLDIVLPVA
jgi:two-component system sensor histidine kinase PhoQ